MMVTREEILDSLERAGFHLTAVPGRGSAPAEEFAIDGGPATVGIVGSVTNPFCDACDRVRLTADGHWRSCLFARREADLRTLLRGGADDAALAARDAGRGRAQAARPRHRRARLHPARPADVGDRRLSDDRDQPYHHRAATQPTSTSDSRGHRSTTASPAPGHRPPRLRPGCSRPEAVTFRMFASARAAAGTAEVHIAPGPTAQVVAALAAGLPPRFADVLAASSLLADGVRLDHSSTGADPRGHDRRRPAPLRGRLT